MEWVSELIGFLILFLLFFFPLLRKLLIDKKRAEEPIEKEQKEEEAPPEEEIEALELPFTPPKAERVEERAFESEIDARHLEMHIAPKFNDRIVSEAFILETQKRKQRKNRVVEITKNRKPSHAMIILSEILSKPKGMS